MRITTLFVSFILLASCSSVDSLRSDYEFSTSNNVGYILISFSEDIKKANQTWGFPGFSSIILKSSNSQSLTLRNQFPGTHNYTPLDYGDNQLSRGHVYVFPVKPGKWKLSDWDLSYGGLVTRRFFESFEGSSEIDIRSGQFIYAGDIHFNYDVEKTTFSYPNITNLNIKVEDKWDEQKEIFTGKYHHLPASFVQKSIFKLKTGE